MGATRVANRTRTDEVAEVLINCEADHIFIDELQAKLGPWAQKRFQLVQTLKYLEHCYKAVTVSTEHFYKAVTVSTLSGEFAWIRGAGLADYVAGPETRYHCPCGSCGGLGEYER